MIVYIFLKCAVPLCIPKEPSVECFGKIIQGKLDSSHPIFGIVAKFAAKISQIKLKTQNISMIKVIEVTRYEEKIAHFLELWPKL